MVIVNVQWLEMEQNRLRGQSTATWTVQDWVNYLKGRLKSG